MINESESGTTWEKFIRHYLTLLLLYHAFASEKKKRSVSAYLHADVLRVINDEKHSKTSSRWSDAIRRGFGWSLTRRDVHLPIGTFQNKDLLNLVFLFSSFLVLRVLLRTCFSFTGDSSWFSDLVALCHWENDLDLDPQRRKSWPTWFHSNSSRLFPSTFVLRTGKAPISCSSLVVVEIIAKKNKKWNESRSSTVDSLGPDCFHLLLFFDLFDLFQRSLLMHGKGRKGKKRSSSSSIKIRFVFKEAQKFFLLFCSTNRLKFVLTEIMIVYDWSRSVLRFVDIVTEWRDDGRWERITFWQVKMLMKARRKARLKIV